MPQSREILDSPMLDKPPKLNIGLQIQTNTQPPQFGLLVFCSAPW